MNPLLPQLSMKPTPGGGLLLHRHVPPLTRRYMAYFCSGAHSSAIPVTFPGSNVYPTKGVALDWLHALSGSLVNDFATGYTRIRIEGGLPIDSTGAFGTNGNSLVGIPGAQSIPGLAAQVLNGTNGSTNSTINGSQAQINLGNSATGTNYIDNTFTYYDNLTYQLGRHTLKAGAQFLRYQQNSFYPGNDGALGNFTYSGVFTSNPNVTSGTNARDSR